MTHYHVPWPPAHLSEPYFHKLTESIRLPHFGLRAMSAAAIIQAWYDATHIPLEEQTIMDFRTLNQPHDLRSQLGLAKATSPDFIEDQTCTNIYADDEPSRLGEQLAKLIAERAPRSLGGPIAMGAISRRHAERIGVIKTQPGKSTLMYHLQAITGKDVRIDGIPIEDFIESVGPEVTAIEASRVTAKSLSIGGMAVGGYSRTGAEAAQIAMKIVSPSMKTRLDSLDEQVLSLLIDVGNRPGHDRRRVDAARTQFELAFMMLKRAIEEG